MKISRLDHVCIRTNQLDVMINWYTKTLGLGSGSRPDFGFGGAWLFVGEQPLIHLIEVSGPSGAGSDQHLKLEHFAFRAHGADELQKRLDQNGEKYERYHSRLSDSLIFDLHDPDGNHVHVDFDSAELTERRRSYQPRAMTLAEASTSRDQQGC